MKDSIISIPNFGNSCYFGVALNILFQNNIFINHLNDNMYTNKDILDEEQLLIYLLCDLNNFVSKKSINNEYLNKKISISKKIIDIYILCCRLLKYECFSQQDPSELLFKLIRVLETHFVKNQIPK